MNNQNWPGGVNRASSNWTGRIQRQMTGSWQPDSEKIPLSGWIGGAVVVAVLLGMFIIGAGVF